MSLNPFILWITYNLVGNESKIGQYFIFRGSWRVKLLIFSAGNWDFYVFYHWEWDFFKRHWEWEIFF